MIWKPAATVAPLQEYTLVPAPPLKKPLGVQVPLMMDALAKELEATRRVKIER